jgi:biopolymer transport protein ExbD
MAQINHAQRHSDDDSTNLMPFINFLVVLIPVLMLSAEFAAVNILSTKLPRNAGTQADSLSLQKSEMDKLVICVSDSSVVIATDNRFLWSKNFTGNEFPANALDTTLQTIRGHLEPDNDRIIVASDARVKYQRIIDVMDFAKKNGFSDISITRWKG